MKIVVGLMVFLIIVVGFVGIYVYVKLNNVFKEVYVNFVCGE